MRYYHARSTHGATFFWRSPGRPNGWTTRSRLLGEINLFFRALLELGMESISCAHCSAVQGACSGAKQWESGKERHRSTVDGRRRSYGGTRLRSVGGRCGIEALSMLFEPRGGGGGGRSCPGDRLIACCGDIRGPSSPRRCDVRSWKGVVLVGAGWCRARRRPETRRRLGRRPGERGNRETGMLNIPAPAPAPPVASAPPACPRSEPLGVDNDAVADPGGAWCRVKWV